MHMNGVVRKVGKNRFLMRKVKRRNSLVQKYFQCESNETRTTPRPPSLIDSKLVITNDQSCFSSKGGLLHGLTHSSVMVSIQNTVEEGYNQILISHWLYTQPNRSLAFTF